MASSGNSRKEEKCKLLLRNAEKFESEGKFSKALEVIEEIINMEPLYAAKVTKPRNTSDSSLTHRHVEHISNLGVAYSLTHSLTLTLTNVGHTHASTHARTHARTHAHVHKRSVPRFES